jgi:hypothetical protein
MIIIGYILIGIPIILAIIIIIAVAIDDINDHSGGYWHM